MLTQNVVTTCNTAISKGQVPLLSYTGDSDHCVSPPWLIDAVRRVFKWIDLDPCTSIEANSRVGACRYYTKDDNGLNKPWRGNVWAALPYSARLGKDLLRRSRKRSSPHT